MAEDKRSFLRWGLITALLVACNASPAATSTTSVQAITTSTGVPLPAYSPDNPDAVAAVEGFLAAEAQGDYAASFDFLSAVDQEQSGDRGAWVAEHLFLLPPITGFQFTSDQVVDDRVEVMAQLELEPGLDELVGLTPGEADTTWVVVEENDEWKVAFTESSLVPLYLEDSGAPAAVKKWVEERRQCATATQWEGGLLGFAALADQLCDASGAVEVGEVTTLADAAESEAFLAAFGPEVGIWARVVPVMSPTPMRAVVAPIGAEWVVIGVLDAA